MINRHDEIWIERGGKVHKSSARFPDEDSVRAAANNIAQSVGRRVDEKTPRLDARLPNGYRIHVVIPPCARKGTTIAIRKFSTVQFTFEDYISFWHYEFGCRSFFRYMYEVRKKYFSEWRNRFR